AIDFFQALHDALLKSREELAGLLCGVHAISHTPVCCRFFFLSLRSLLFSVVNGPIPDIRAHLATLEMDLPGNLVSAALRHPDAVAQGSYTENASTGRHDLFPVFTAPCGTGTRMENMIVLFRWQHCRQGGQPLDDIALAGRIGISTRRHDHRQRGAPVPLGLYLVQVPRQGMLDEGDKIALETQQDDFGFRIAHAAVKLEHFYTAARRNHEAGIKKTGVALTFLFHPAYRRLDDFPHYFSMEGGCNRWSGGIGTHAAGVGPLVAFLQSLVILARGQWQGMAAIAHDDETDFLAFHKFFDHNLRCCLAWPLFAQHLVHGG